MAVGGGGRTEGRGVRAEGAKSAGAIAGPQRGPGSGSRRNRANRIYEEEAASPIAAPHSGHWARPAASVPRRSSLQAGQACGRRCWRVSHQITRAAVNDTRDF